jgi:hypothetical protein
MVVTLRRKGGRLNTYKELVMRISTTRTFCRLETRSVQVRGMGRASIMQSVMVLKNPFNRETNLTDRQ